MSTSRNKKNQLTPGTNQVVAASTGSKKSNPGSNTSKSKYGGGRSAQFGSSRTNILSSASKKNIGGQGDKPYKAHVQIFDENGQDVTPLPLLHQDQNVLKKNQSNLLGESSGGTPTDMLSQASIYNVGTVTASTFGGGPFTRSVFSQSVDTGSESLMGEDIEPSTDISSAWADIRHKREEVKEILTDSDLEKTVDLTLTETETIWLLDMPGVCVSVETDEANIIKDKNEKYQERNAAVIIAATSWASVGFKNSISTHIATILRAYILLLKNRAGNDRYAERGMNTFNEPPKFKTVQTNKITYAETGVMATTWDMYDTFEQMEKEAKAEKDDEDQEEGTISRPGSAKKSPVDSGEAETAIQTPSNKEKSRGESATRKTMESRGTMGSSLAGSESMFAVREEGIPTDAADLQAIADERILKSDELKMDLFNMERVINLNTYQAKQALYRGRNIVIDIDQEKARDPLYPVADMGPNFDRLWAYTCHLTKGRNVSCMAWNKLNPDLIAVGYGQFEFTNQKSGLICCWCLKNPEFPERIYTCKEGVTALDFSRANPSLLAVGLYDGGVGIYNVKKTDDEPVIDNFESAGKHTGPVWQIKWIEKDRASGEDKAEVLVSVSTDGRITQWSIRKGFESYDLMRLKRVPIRASGKSREKKGEAFICRYAGGFCFDFHKNDSNIYLAGTEEGHIHKCSCSYNEQFLDSFSAHTGPIYKIQWSPFVSNVFLSCSADWTVRLWHQDRNKAVLTFTSSTKSVFDLCWSPRSSTVFACVNEGAVEVWDLSISTLDPIIVSTPTSGAKLTSVSFAQNSECILVGDSEGQVTVYQLRSMPDLPEKPVDALNGIIKASLASQLQTGVNNNQNNIHEEDLEEE